MRPDWTGNYANHDWNEYYDQVAGRAPRELLLEALQLVAEHDPPASDAGSRQAIDLGAGAGTETLALLQAGWSVHAVDRTPGSIDRVRTRAAAAGVLDRLTTAAAAFEDVSALPAAALVHSSFSLPFCPPAAFAAMWAVVTEAVVPGGWLAINLFGDHDDFAANPTVTTLPEDEVRGLLTDFDVHHWDVVDEDGETAAGEPKHWHIVSVIARRRGDA